MQIDFSYSDIPIKIYFQRGNGQGREEEERTKREIHTHIYVHIYSGRVPRWILANRDNAAISKLPLGVSDIFIRLIIRVETRRYQFDKAIVDGEDYFICSLSRTRTGWPNLVPSIVCHAIQSWILWRIRGSFHECIELVEPRIGVVRWTLSKKRSYTPWHREHCETNRTIRPAVPELGLFVSFLHIFLSIGG